jgi:putative membrane protein
MMHGDGTPWMMMGFGALVWIGLIGLAGWALGRYLRPRETELARRETPLEILEHRYASGEIGADEFDEARARIREDDVRR